MTRTDALRRRPALRAARRRVLVVTVAYAVVLSTSLVLRALSLTVAAGIAGAVAVGLLFGVVGTFAVFCRGAATEMRLALAPRAPMQRPGVELRGSAAWGRMRPR